jgi:membrane protease YdiL (CAAX protease family)
MVTKMVFSLSALFSRPRAVRLAGIVLVPTAAFYVPFVSPYSTVLIGAALAILMVWIKPGSPIRELGLGQPRRIGRAIVLGTTVGIGLVVLSRLLLTPVLEHLTGTHRDLSSFDYLRGNGRALLTLLPLVWVSAGICEEVVYRGYLITQGAALLGNSRLARLAAVLLAAILFALAHGHQGLSGMLLTGTLGVLFGLLFLQQRENLWVNMVAHIVGDTATLAAITLGWDRWLELDHLGRYLLFEQ